MDWVGLGSSYTVNVTFVHVILINFILMCSTKKKKKNHSNVFFELINSCIIFYPYSLLACEISSEINNYS